MKLRISLSTFFLRGKPAVRVGRIRSHIYPGSIYSQQLFSFIVSVWCTPDCFVHKELIQFPEALRLGFQLCLDKSRWSFESGRVMGFKEASSSIIVHIQLSLGDRSHDGSFESEGTMFSGESRIRMVEAIFRIETDLLNTVKNYVIVFGNRVCYKKHLLLPADCAHHRRRICQ